ncbi:hypothetical protein [Methylobacterium sp. J-076]|uniref:hypothetical protein n=1 Tax=Methylobacterium sp. J-076 TaxID=2836655 RepID=UPI001FBBBFC9|nr:hypothetical protein [Methylobacterium sp. J-076]MCJ2013459.1 hypothetical protein [Methylobacterium sp. J-076]
MTLRQSAVRLPLLAIFVCAGLAPAAARDDAFADAPPHRVRRVHRPVGLPPVYGPPPALVSDYLPRNNAVPMYNEPPGIRDRGAYGR